MYDVMYFMVGKEGQLMYNTIIKSVRRLFIVDFYFNSPAGHHDDSKRNVVVLGMAKSCCKCCLVYYTAPQTHDTASTSTVSLN